MLGQRIKSLRKQKKLTLEALAGEGLTKGMLSLIENNKANPSMESLTYIANRLEVKVVDLLGEISTHELRETLEKAEKLYNSESKNLTDKYKQLITLIEPYIQKLSQGYESARLLDIYSRCLYQEKQKNWQVFFEQAAKIYDEMNLTSKRANLGLFRAMVKFLNHDYKKALEILLNERTIIETTHAYIDPMTRIDFDYNEAILHFAVGDSEKAIIVMENAINFSRKHRIFYRIDYLYRLATSHALMTDNEEKKEHYLLKLKQYGEFADDRHSKIFYDLLSVMSLISEKHEYSKALEITEQYLSNPKLTKEYEPWFFLEKGKALYGLEKFNDAIVCLEKIEIPSFVHHPFDFSVLYIMDSFKALCHINLGNWGKALQASKIAVEHFESLPPSTYKNFAIETYNTIKKKVDN
jgi:transcriptional regulator with XRE-family HTH domain